MINWKEEYKNQNRFLIGITIILAIALILFLIGFKGITEKTNKKDEKIRQQQIEIIDLKEQIYRLEVDKNEMYR